MAQATTTTSISATAAANANQPPEAPIPYAPLWGATKVSLTPELSTEDFIDPDGDTHAESQWQVSRVSNFSWLALDVRSGFHLTALTVPNSLLDGGKVYYWRVRFYDDRGGESGWSETYPFITELPFNDTNSNGIPDDQEIDVTVDVDGNTVPDIDQIASDPTFKCLDTGISEAPIGIQGFTNVYSIESVESIDPGTISDVTDMPPSLPFGLISFKLKTMNPGDSAQVVVHFSETVASEAKWYTYDSVNGWQDYSAHASFDSEGKSVLLDFEDGGYGDSDGVANGIIVHLGAVGLLSSASSATAISADSG